LLSKGFHAIGLGGVDRVLGVALGLGLSGLIVSIAVMFVSLTKFTEEPMWQNSMLAPKFIKAAEWIQTNAPPQMTALLEQAGISTDGADESEAVNATPN
jgi:membrane protein required for colicin V production